MFGSQGGQIFKVLQNEVEMPTAVRFTQPVEYVQPVEMMRPMVTVPIIMTRPVMYESVMELDEDQQRRMQRQAHEKEEGDDEENGAFQSTTLKTDIEELELDPGLPASKDERFYLELLKKWDELEKEEKRECP